MMFSDMEYQNDKINNALHRLYIMNEKFNVHFPNLKENLDFYKNKKKCENLKLKFFFYCIISSILIFNVTIYYHLAILLVFSCFVFIASLWGIIYYYYSHRIADLPSFVYYLFLINFLIYVIFLFVTPIGNNDFTIIPEQIIIIMKFILCVLLFINYFRYSKQIENEYCFLDVLDNLVTEQQIEFKEQDEIYEDNAINEIQEDKIIDEVKETKQKELINEIQETKQEEVLNQSVPEETEQNDNQSSKNKRNNFSVFNDLKNFFASIYSVEEARKHPFSDFLDAAKEKYSEIPFIGIRYSLLYYDGTIKRSDSKNIDKDFIYDPDTIEQYYSKYCNNKLC